MELEKKAKEESEKEEPRIDPSTSPYTPHNLEAARKLRVRYSPGKKCYVDEDGCLVRDKFGQPF